MHARIQGQASVLEQVGFSIPVSQETVVLLLFWHWFVGWLSLQSAGAPSSNSLDLEDWFVANNSIKDQFSGMDRGPPGEFIVTERGERVAPCHTVTYCNKICLQSTCDFAHVCSRLSQ